MELYLLALFILLASAVLMLLVKNKELNAVLSSLSLIALCGLFPIIIKILRYGIFENVKFDINFLHQTILYVIDPCAAFFMAGIVITGILCSICNISNQVNNQRLFKKS